MSWCPKCKVEYEEGIKYCSDCKSVLVKEIEKNKPDTNKTGITGEVQYDEPKLLISVSESREAEMIEAMLKSSKIPVLVKDKGVGSYSRIYLGFSKLGTDIYVPSKLYEKAKRLIDIRPEETDINSADEETKNMINEEEKYNRKKRRIARLILIYSYLGLVVFIIYKVLDAIF